MFVTNKSESSLNAQCSVANIVPSDFDFKIIGRLKRDCVLRYDLISIYTCLWHNINIQGE